MKYDLNTLVIFCESEKEKQGAIDFFYKKWKVNYTNKVKFPSKNWGIYPYVKYSKEGNYIHGRGIINDKKYFVVVPFKKIKNFKIYVPKWKKIDWTQ